MKSKETLKGINKSFIKTSSADVGIEDVQNVVEKGNDIKSKVVNSDLLKRFSEDVKLLIAMIRDYWNGIYRTVPWWVIASVVFALLYVLDPIDLIPDVIPVLGLTDDAAVLALCLAMTEKDILKYQGWKNLQEQTGEGQ